MTSGNPEFNKLPHYSKDSNHSLTLSFFTFLYDKKRIINSYQKPFLHMHHIKIFERNKIEKEKWCLKCLVKFLFSRP